MTTIRKRHAWIRSTLDETARTWTFAAMRMKADGEAEQNPDIAPIVFDTRKASDANRDYAALHGFKQRICDTAALGADATMAEKFAEMAKLRDHYESGSAEWDLPRAGRVKRELTAEEKLALAKKLAAELGLTLS